MEAVTIQLPEVVYLRLKSAANQANNSIEAFIYERVTRLPEIDGSFDPNQEPEFQAKKYESDIPLSERPPIISSETHIELDGDFSSLRLRSDNS